MGAYGLVLLGGVLQGFSMAWPDAALGNVLGITGTPSGLLQVLSLALLGATLLQVASQEAAIDGSGKAIASASSASSSAGATGKRAWLQGAALASLFATTAMVSTWGWLYVAMHRYGDMPAALSALAVLLLALALSVYFGVAGAIWVALVRRSILSLRVTEGRVALHASGQTLTEVRQGLSRMVLFAALWTLAELARGEWFTGFPWGAGGYAHPDSQLATYLPWLGVYGVGGLASLLAMAIPVTIALLMSQRTKAWQWLAVGAVLMAWIVPVALNAYGTQFTTSTGHMTVRLLQGNIPQDEKFVGGMGVKVALNWYSEQLMANEEALVVTPETAIPVLPQQLPTDYWKPLREKFANAAHDGKPAQLALIGIPMGGLNVGYSNSVLGMGPTDTAYRYDKQHLVPFGEFVPPFFQWFVRMMNIPLGEFGQARPAASIMSWQGQRLLPQICYEDLFGEELARYFLNEQQAPTVLVNMSNLAWFGDTTAAAQHVLISRMRALEFQRPIIRATNTGMTALIDAQGHINFALPAFTRGVLLGSFEGRSGLTPYAQWTSRWGLLPLWSLCFAIVLVFIAFSRRSGPQAL